MFHRKIKAIEVSIAMAEANTTADGTLIGFVVGSIITRRVKGKEVQDEIVAIWIDEKRMAVEICYSHGSKVVYKGYRFIYTL